MSSPVTGFSFYLIVRNSMYGTLGFCQKRFFYLESHMKPDRIPSHELTFSRTSSQQTWLLRPLCSCTACLSSQSFRNSSKVCNMSNPGFCLRLADNSIECASSYTKLSRQLLADFFRTLTLCLSFFQK